MNTAFKNSARIHAMSRPPRSHKTRIVFAALTVLVVGLVVFRLYLPTLIKNKTNETLSKIPGYYGHIDDVGIHLWRGAYSIERLKLLKTSGKVPVPFVGIDAIDFSIAWKPLFRGNLSGKVELVNPKINFVSGGSPAEEQTSVDKSWQDRAKELFPLRIARLGIKNGEIHFRNYQATPPIDIFIHQIYLVATNLTNSMRFTNTLKATVDGTAIAMSDGQIKMHMLCDPLGAKPTFNMDLQMEDLALPQLNDFFAHYLAVTMKTGVLSVYMEGAADQGKFVGYVKPLLRQVDLVKIKEDAGIGEFFKGLAVKLVSYLLKNHPKDQLATRIEIHGDLEHPEINIWTAVSNFLSNWLIKAIEPGIEERVSLKAARKQELPLSDDH